MLLVSGSLGGVFFRLIGGLLAGGFAVCLMIWLDSGGGLSWFTTALVVGFSTFLRTRVRGLATPPRVSSWLQGLDKVFEGVRERFGEFSQEFFFRIAWAVLFGISIATLEQSIVVNVLLQGAAMPAGLKGLLSLPIVLIPTYFVLGLITMGQEHVTPSWLRLISEGLREWLHIPELDLTDHPKLKVLANAAVRGVSSTMVRGVAMVVFPVIFSSWPGYVTVGLAVLLPIYFWEHIVAWREKRRARLANDSDPEIDEP